MDRKDKSREFPTEILWEFFRHALQSPMPKQDANLFEQMDVFAHPCKIYVQTVSTRQSLRLVCRRWNTVISEWHPREQNGGVLIVDSAFEQEITSENLRFVDRFEAVVGWRESYCRTWPCIQATERHGPGISTIENVKPVRIPPGDSPGRNIKVLRFLDEPQESNPLLPFLRQWKGLEALWIGNIALLMQFDGLPKSLVQEMFNNITYLHLFCTHDTSPPRELQLPMLTYLSLEMNLASWASGVFPLKLSAPTTSTVLLSGSIDCGYIRFIKRLILPMKESLKHLLVSLDLDQSPGDFVFPFRPLKEFSRFQTLGVALRILTSRFPVTCKDLSPSITLVLLGLDDTSFHVERGARRRWVKNLCAVFLLPSKPFSHIVVPFEWREIESIMVQQCLSPEERRYDSLNKADPLPCHWSVLQKTAEHGIPILDRSGVSMKEGSGAKFVQRMEEIINDEKYMEERRKAVKKARSPGSSDDDDEKGDIGWEYEDDEDEDEDSMED